MQNSRGKVGELLYRDEETWAASMETLRDCWSLSEEKKGAKNFYGY